MSARSTLFRMYSHVMSNGVDKALSPGQLAKKTAAFRAVDEFVKNGQVLGIGTGSTAKFLVERLAEKVAAKELSGIVCIPSSFSARSLIIQNSLPLSDLEINPHIDLCIDGADEIDPQLNCIKGGGGCLLQEKVVQFCSDRFILIADDSKSSAQLGEKWQYVPIEVLPSAYLPIAKRIEKSEGGNCVLRMAAKKAGALVTDNGNFILDWDFPKGPPRTTEKWCQTHSRIKLMPGVIETGLFLNVAERAVIGSSDGTAQIITPQ